MSSLEIQRITKTFGRFRALDEVSLSIHPGVFGLLGPNGAGKTTLMRILATLLQPDSGGIQYRDTVWNWRKSDPVKQQIGFLPQTFSFYPYLRLREALEYIAALKQLKHCEVTQEIDRVLEMTNLGDHATKHISQLSGGMMRRFGIAQAMLGSPSIIIADEPTAGLDPAERVRFRNLFWDLASERIVVLSTHIVQDIEAICNQVAILKAGRIVACGEPSAIMNVARGHVRSEVVDEREFQQISNAHDVVSFTPESDGIHARYLDMSCYVESSVEPTLEDAYLMLMKRGGL